MFKLFKHSSKNIAVTGTDSQISFDENKLTVQLSKLAPVFGISYSFVVGLYSWAALALGFERSLFVGFMFVAVWSFALRISYSTSRKLRYLGTSILGVATTFVAYIVIKSTSALVMILTQGL